MLASHSGIRIRWSLNVRTCYHSPVWNITSSSLPVKSLQNELSKIVLFNRCCSWIFSSKADDGRQVGYLNTGYCHIHVTVYISRSCRQPNPVRRLVLVVIKLAVTVGGRQVSAEVCAKKFYIILQVTDQADAVTRLTRKREFLHLCNNERCIALEYDVMLELYGFDAGAQCTAAITANDSDTRPEPLSVTARTSYTS